MKRQSEEGFISSKKIKLSEDDDQVTLVLDDDNAHLANLLRNRMNKTTIQQYTFRLENEKTIQLDSYVHSYRYYPNLNGLAFAQSHTISLFDFTTQSIRTLLTLASDEYDSDYDSDDEDDSILLSIRDFEITKDQSIVYLRRRMIYSSKEYSIVKKDMVSRDVIWECDLFEKGSHLAYHQQLDMLFIGIDNDIYRIDVDGKLSTPVRIMRDGFLSGIFIDAVGKVYITEFDESIIIVYLLKEDGMNVEREMTFTLVESKDIVKTVDVIDDRFIITNCGHIYDWNTGSYMGELIDDDITLLKGGRLFKCGKKESINCISYDLRIEKELVDCPLGKSECKMIESLGGTIPEYYIPNQGLSSVLFLQTCWNQQQKYMLNDHRLKFNQIITFMENTIAEHLYDITSPTSENPCGVLIATDETYGLKIYYNTNNSMIEIRFRDVTFELSLLDFLYRMKKIHVEYFGYNVANIDYGKIVQNVPPQNLSNSDYYKALTIGMLLRGEDKGKVLRLLERLGGEQVIVGNWRFLKADLLMAYLCNISRSLDSEFLRID